MDALRFIQQSQQGDLPTQKPHGEERHEEGHDVGQHRCHRAHRVLGVEHVAGEPAHQGAGLGSREEGDRHPLHVVVEGGAEVVDEALTDLRSEPPVDQADGGGGQGQAHHSRRQQIDAVEVMAGDGVIDQPLDEQRWDDADDGSGHDGQQVGAEQHPVGRDKTPDPA
jgi:hypothetical protein